MKVLIHYIRVWNMWRKHSGDSRLQKLLVLFGLIRSPTFNLVSEEF